MKIVIYSLSIQGILKGINGIQNIGQNRSLNIIERMLNRFGILQRFFPGRLESPTWINEARDADLIIQFDAPRNYARYCEKIEQVAKPSAKLVMYLWNPVSHSDDHKKLSSRWLICSFSECESRKYGFHFVHTFYNSNLVTYAAIENDIMFLGLDKGRKTLLNNIEQIAIVQGLNPSIIIVDNLKALYNKSYQKHINYSQLLSLVARSRCLLEVIQSSQSAPTLRCMESIFFKKKLITNNIGVKSYDFYTPDNIFIIGEDDWGTLSDFVKTPYVDLPDEILAKYDFPNWLNQILSYTF